MSDNKDCCWVFDSLVGFLQGPIWSSPLLTFIEERSLIFESETEDSQEYREAYQDYKNLVDLLLGCYMEDMGITPQQFEQACAANKNTKLPMQFQKSLFEQIWAANEYEIFKRMMIQKNLELQLQALSMIEQKFGLTPASFSASTCLVDEELEMEKLIHQQIQEEEEETKINETEADLEQEHKRLSSKYQNEKAALDEILRVSVSINSSRSSSPEPKYSQVDETILPSLSTINKLSVVKKMKNPAPLGPIPINEKIEEKKETESGVQEEIKKREDYLKARRDKLVALKKQARSQRLENNRERPGSARNLAEATLMGKQDFEKSQLPDSSIIQVRKALAARLKAEVVGA